eukprot:8723678-Pyramimonas_sp.AAC.1
MLFVHSHLETSDVLQGKAPKLLASGNAMADAFATRGADESKCQKTVAHVFPPRNTRPFLPE